jgi:hypothetical protein|tara:strand:- start:67 stop:261 length:195 start_codon:yes stop_codon:yes gene_type:complete
VALKEIIMALGLLAVIEGLVLALVPLRLEDLLKVLRDTPIQTLRNIGLGVIALGVAIVWIAQYL